MNRQSGNEGDLKAELQRLVGSLSGEDGLRRQEARLALVRIGRPAVPELISVLEKGNEYARWEAAEALAEIHDPAAAPVLVERLKDDDMNVRGAASRALIAVGRAGLPALLQGLVTDFTSPRLRWGAHHVLHALKNVGHLREEEIRVFELMQGTFPNVEELPWQAAAALQALGRSAREAPRQERSNNGRQRG